MFRLLRRNDSLTARIILLSLVTITGLMLVAAGAISWAFNQSVRRSVNNQLLAYLDVMIASTSLDERGKIQLDDDFKLLENVPRYWQINVGTKPIKRSPSLSTSIPLTPGVPMETQAVRFRDNGISISAVQKTIIFPGNQRVTYLFGVQSTIARAFKNEERTAFYQVLVPLLLCCVAVLVCIIYVQIRVMVSPLEKVKQALLDVRAGNTDRLPQHHFPREIQPLADELNLLITYGTEIVARHRTFASNLSHALKTPLSALRNEAHDDETTLGQLVRDKAAIMQTIIDRNLARVNAAGMNNLIMAKADLTPIITKTAQSFGKLYQRELQLDVPESLYFHGDEGDAYEMLGNIIENACKYGKTCIHVHAHQDAQKIFITIEDDGEGIPEDQRQNLPKRGARLDETVPGTGIGLAITYDIIKLYGGHFTLGSSKTLGGLQVDIELPAY